MNYSSLNLSTPIPDESLQVNRVSSVCEEVILDDLKFGCVSYLNSRPFFKALESTSVEFASPSHLASQLRKGALDCALVPVWECLVNPGYRIVDGFCIGCHGAVYSVILKHSKPLNELKTIALDLNSQTSVRLLQILCWNYFKISPLFVEEGESADGHLLIGDRAIEARTAAAASKEFEIQDLGEAWKNYTQGLGFIFAVWAIHPESRMNGQQIEYFRALLSKSISEPYQYATNAFEKHYLTEYIRYQIGREKREGLQQFGRELVELGLLPRGKPELLWV